MTDMAGGERAAPAATDYDVIVIGGGFGGVYGVYRYQKQGLSVLGVEGAADVGGVWRHNCYPGARCDVESIDYSYSFSPELQQEWNWTERYPSQPEILAYIQHVATRFDLRKHFLFNTRIVSAERRPDTGYWEVGTDAGKTITCRFLVLATGQLSTPKEPDFEGLKTFRGEWYQTSRWPDRSPVLKGKRVGVIGTGSSGVQTIPMIAKEAEHLYVFQRTAVFTVPAGNGPIDQEDYAAIKARYEAYREETRNSRGGSRQLTTGRPGTEFSFAEKKEMWDKLWVTGAKNLTSMFTDTLSNIKSNTDAANYVRDKIRETVKDPVVAEKLCPYDHPISTRRICLDTGYYETYNRPNVTLVDVRNDPIQRITENGIKTRDAEYELDTIVFALGFDAFTGPVAAIDPRNEKGERLVDKWREGPRTYLGFMSAGFPNLFIITGPQSPSVLANMVAGVEQGIDWVGDCIDHLDKHGLNSIEARPEYQEDWVQHVAELANRTLYVKANSWYMGANVAGKARVFHAYIGGFDRFTQKCRDVAANGYEGFLIA